MPRVEGSLDDGAAAIVFRPSRIQWLLSHEESEMADVVVTISAAAAQQLEQRELERRRQEAAAAPGDVEPERARMESGAGGLGGGVLSVEPP